MERRWADVAELIATQGLKGRFVARPVRDLPFLLEEGMEVFFVPPTLDGPRSARVHAVRHAGSGEYLVDFAGVCSRDTAEVLAGSHCLVSRSQLPDDFEDLLRPGAERVDGYRVVDEKLGFMGPVVEVREMPTQDLISIDYEGREVLVPFVDEFIVRVDEEAGVVHANIPASLLSLNSTASEK